MGKASRFVSRRTRTIVLTIEFGHVCEDVIDPRDYSTDPNPVKAITQRYHTALERLIRQYPTQYFWLHRRWKTQPTVRKGK